ncbi:MAG: ABC transporter substrate-binding protein [Desulfarculaceae bacterium]
MKRILICILALTLAAVLAGFALAATPKRGGTLNVAMMSDAWSLDPIHVQSTTGERVVHDSSIGECLYDWDPTVNKFIPRLAIELPKISPDGKVYTIKLRKGVKFHDGTPYNAEAQAFSIMRIIDPKNNSCVQKKYKHVENAEALDEHTLKITLKSPDSSFIIKLATRDTIAVSPTAVKKYGKDFGTKAMVGTGPFRLVKWTQGDRIVVERNPDYWNKKLPYLDKIVYKIIPEEATALMQLRLGEVHILEDVARKDIKTLKEDKKVKVYLITGTQHEQIYLNTARKPFNDVRVRQALAYAIDRKAIIEGIFEGYAVESVGPYHPWFWTHNPEWKQPYSYNPKKAKALLKEAGYGPDNPLKFELMATNQNMFVDQAVMVQAFMKDVGAKVEVLPLEKSTLFDRIYGRKAFKGKPEMFEAALEDWSSNVVDPEASAERLFSSKAGSNKCYYANPEVDKMFAEVKKLRSIEEQKKIYYQTEKIIAKDVPTVWICNPQDAVAARVEVKGFKPDGEVRLPLIKTWLE